MFFSFYSRQLILDVIPKGFLTRTVEWIDHFYCQVQSERVADGDEICLTRHHIPLPIFSIGEFSWSVSEHWLNIYRLHSLVSCLIYFVCISILQYWADPGNQNPYQWKTMSWSIIATWSRYIRVAAPELMVIFHLLPLPHKHGARIFQISWRLNLLLVDYDYSLLIVPMPVW